MAYFIIFFLTLPLALVFLLPHWSLLHNYLHNFLIFCSDSWFWVSSDQSLVMVPSLPMLLPLNERDFIHSFDFIIFFLTNSYKFLFLTQTSFLRSKFISAITYSIAQLWCLTHIWNRTCPFLHLSAPTSHPKPNFFLIFWSLKYSFNCLSKILRVIIKFSFFSITHIQLVQKSYFLSLQKYVQNLTTAHNHHHHHLLNSYSHLLISFPVSTLPSLKFYSQFNNQCDHL